MRKYLIGCGIVILMLSSCSQHTETNQMIAESNSAMFTAFGDSMAKQTTEGGRMAVGLLYGIGAGRQSFYREDTVVDYANAFLPYASLFMPFIYSGYGGSTYDASGNGQINISNYDESYNTNYPTEQSYNTTETTSIESSDISREPNE